MNYTAQDIQNFIGSYENHFSHVVVAHTNFRPYNSTKVQIEKMATQAKKDCRHALNCFNKLLFPNSKNKTTRHPELYRPLTFVTIEGANETADKAQTIHFNITLGNLPIKLTAEEVQALFTHAWHVMAKQSSNVMAYEYNMGTNRQWIGYTLKEAQQATKKAWETNGIWDAENCWIPHAALNAD